VKDRTTTTTDLETDAERGVELGLGDDEQVGGPECHRELNGAVVVADRRRGVSRRGGLRRRDVATSRPPPPATWSLGAAEWIGRRSGRDGRRSWSFV